MKDRGKIRQNPNLSQVFLTTDEPCRRLVDELLKWDVKRVLEIGPGEGILTFCLLEKGIDVTAVEMDSRYSRQLVQTYDRRRVDGWGHLEVENQDILRLDLGEWLGQAPNVKNAVVGNIPYAITSPILTWILPYINKLSGAIFLVQLEFAERLASAHGSRAYGSISVFTQLRAKVELICEVDRTNFTPIPKVDSALISLKPKEVPWTPEQLRKIEVTTRAAFSQRRKKLSNAIKSFLGHKDPNSVPVDLNLRAEALAPEEFVKLAKFIFPEAF